MITTRTSPIRRAEATGVSFAKPVFDVTTRYELERELGRGGMGTVYRSRDRASGQIVAVKVLRRALVRDLLRFGREVGVLAALDHPGIVRYLGHGQLPNGKAALIMEWVEGETLSARLATRGLTLAQSVATVAQVAEALAHAHERGVVHRDVKPDNILYVDEQHTKLIDFGVARRTGEALALTRTGMRIGTPCYMSPEQARGERDIDARADVFMLGCVLYECITGHRPFAAANAQALLAKVLLAEPAPIDLYCPEAPVALIALVARMMSKDPVLRWSDAGAVASALRALPGMPDVPARVQPPRVEVAVSATAEMTRAEPEKPVPMSTFVMLMVPPEDDDELDTDEETYDDAERDKLVATLHHEAKQRGMHVEVLANGSVLGVLSSAEPRTQLATRLAECALSIKQRAPDVAVAFLGDHDAGAQDPIGATIERGFVNLETAAIRALGLLGHDANVIHLDETTAGLLGDRFDVVRGATGFQLVVTGAA